MTTETKLLQLLRLFAPLLMIALLISPAFFAEQVCAQERKIVLVTDPWPPHYGPKFKNGGYFTEIVKESFKRVGYDCVVEYVPWKRALEGTKAGTYDGILGLFYSEERTEFFTYSEPVSQVNLVFFKKAGRVIPFRVLQSLSSYKIGVVRDYFYSEEFKNAYYLSKEEVTSVELNIEKLVADRIDLFIDSKEVVQHVLQTSFPSYKGLLDSISPPYRVKNLYISVSKQNPRNEQIVQDFNLGLKMIKADGTYDAIMESRGF